MISVRPVAMTLAGLLVLVLGVGAAAAPVPEAVLDLALDGLEPLPPDPSNRYADDPAAAALGAKLFFDTRLSSNGKVACSTCHVPDRQFQDGTPLAHGVGVTARRTMPVAGMAYAPFLFWDGRKDSLWAQALGPLESPVEHGGNRAQYAQVIARHYRADYEKAFGPLPELRGDGVTAVFVSIGKAIAAYERQVQYGPSRVDSFIEAWRRNDAPPAGLLSDDERKGLALFTGKANCVQCHNGPLYTNHEFHNTGVPRGAAPDRGRFAGIAAVRADEFSCASRWSDARGRCPELDFLAPAGAEHERAFKVPSLRNVAERAPYMHAGQFATLAQVLDHYNRAPVAPSGTSELHALRLDTAELRQLEAFLRALSGEVIAPAAPGLQPVHSRK
jgi:cytochrome c peroxidase